jgi:hypothetical protein
MRVAENDGVERLRVERKIAVAFDGFVTPALKQAAFEQQPPLIQFQKKHRSGRRAGGAEEVELHGARMAAGETCSKFKVRYRILPRSRA